MTMEEIIKICEANAVLDSEIDFSDIPEVTDAEAKEFHRANSQEEKSRRKKV